MTKYTIFVDSERKNAPRAIARAYKTKDTESGFVTVFFKEDEFRRIAGIEEDSIRNIIEIAIEEGCYEAPYGDIYVKFCKKGGKE